MGCWNCECWNYEGQVAVPCSVCGLCPDGDDADAGENIWRDRWISLLCSALLAGGFLLVCVLIALAIGGAL